MGALGPPSAGAKSSGSGGGSGSGSITVTAAVAVAVAVQYRDPSGCGSGSASGGGSGGGSGSGRGGGDDDDVADDADDAQNEGLLNCLLNKQIHTCPIHMWLVLDSTSQYTMEHKPHLLVAIHGMLACALQRKPH
eukprot:11648027-Karenia_brevis.AAC.1